MFRLLSGVCSGLGIAAGYWIGHSLFQAPDNVAVGLGLAGCVIGMIVAIRIYGNGPTF